MHDLSEEVNETCKPVVIPTAIIRSILIQTAYLLPAKWPEFPITVRFNRSNFGTNCVSSFCQTAVNFKMISFVFVLFFRDFRIFFSLPVWCKSQVKGGLPVCPVKMPRFSVNRIFAREGLRARRHKVFFENDHEWWIFRKLVCQSTMCY